MLFNIPLSPGKATRLIELLDCSTESRVLDAGCGTGEFLIRLLENQKCHATGIDLNPESIAEATKNASARLSADSYQFRVANVREEQLEEGAFDVAICLGSTHAFGSGEEAYPKALRELTKLVRAGGHLLIGEGYWKQPPDPEYLKLIGDPVGIYHDHSENVLFARERGLVPLYATTSSEEDWDHFEWSHQRKIERKAALKPDDEQLAEKLDRRRAWLDGYLRWGRSTMGFGFYLFQTR